MSKYLYVFMYVFITCTYVHVSTHLPVFICTHQAGTASQLAAGAVSHSCNSSRHKDSPLADLQVTAAALTSNCLFILEADKHVINIGMK
jgi:hypothetical protein